MLAADPIPFARGAKWTYNVNIKRFDAETGKVNAKTIEWVTEVVDAKEGNGVMAYSVRGWPEDLLDYDGVAPAPTATVRTILRRNNAFLFGETAEPTIEGAIGWFSWPVVDGQRICPAKITYCWEVASVETGYRLTFISGPDEQAYEIEPGTGIAVYRYMDHQKTHQIEAKLISFKTPERK